MALLVIILAVCLPLLILFWEDIFPNTAEGELQSEGEEETKKDKNNKNIFLIIGIGVVVGFLLLVAFNLSFSHIMAFSPRYVKWMQVHSKTSQYIGTIINTIYVMLSLALIGIIIVIIKAYYKKYNGR